MRVFRMIRMFHKNVIRAAVWTFAYAGIVAFLLNNEIAAHSRAYMNILGRWRECVEELITSGMRIRGANSRL